MTECRVDGMHQEDIANYVVEFPNSNIAELANTGVTYNNMFLPAPSDSWPALAHQVTGSGPGQHGIMYGACSHKDVHIWHSLAQLSFLV